MNRHLLKMTLLSSLMSITTLTYADDSEIFFNEAIKHVKPNVIFLLDGSGSMSWDPNPKMINSGSNATGEKSRMEILKSSLATLFKDDSTTGVRAGIIRFSAANVAKNSLWNLQPVIDIDDSEGNDLTNQITVTKSNDTTTLIQPVLTDVDDGWEVANNNSRSCLINNPYRDYSTVCVTAAGRNSQYYTYVNSSNKIIGYRFNSILLKPTSTAENIKSAYLTFRVNQTINSSISLSLTIDAKSDAPYFSENWNVLGANFANSKAGKKTFTVQKGSGLADPIDGACLADNFGGLPSFRCNVTSLIQQKIMQSGWQAGNAITFYLTDASTAITPIFRENGTNIPNLKITVNNSIVSDKSVFTNRRQLTSQAYTLTPYGGTYIGNALYETARYISNYGGGATNPGPSHSNNLGESPLLEGCQLTHIILMTDGMPTTSSANALARYMTKNASASDCKIFTNDDLTQSESDSKYASSNGAEACARAFVSWMARKDQSNFNDGANYIYTNTIGFAIPESEEGSANKTYLKELADFGKGKPYAVKEEDTLLKAFKDIISDARAADSPSGSGQVTMSAQSRYQQRLEVFYALYASDAYDYWAGNMKRFQLEYINANLASDKTATRAILVDKKSYAAMNIDGTIKNTASSYWDNSNGDGGKVSSGGVLGMLMYAKEDGKEIADPTTRNMQVARADKTLTKIKLDSFPTITITDLDLKGTNTTLGLTDTNAEDVKKGLLNFILGYDYNIDANKKTTAVSYLNKKIGDSAKASVSLVNYNCIKADSTNKSDIKACQMLNQVALLASNDGLFRGYDTNTGTALYEIIPEEMLSIIKNLQIRKVLNFQTPRSYGLDGTVVTYLTNNSDYVKGSTGSDATGKAYAYITAGRGGKFIYAFDISNMSNPDVAWTISNKGNFENLGYTWSTPTLGKIKQNGNIIPVLVFGGGYDLTTTDTTDTAALRTSQIGSAIYIVNAINGELIQKIKQPKMNYSIPSRISLVTDDGTSNTDNQKLITDIITGDTGGQVWRFAVNTTEFNVTTPYGENGLIASLSGSGSRDTRKFFQSSALSVTTINGVKTLNIGLGSGLRTHPISTDVDDRIYLLKYPKDSTSTKVLTEDDLATTSSTGDSFTGNLDNGFMIKLAGVGSDKGEKVVSDGIVAFDRIVFNTYIPKPTDIKTCKPSSGTQRTYNYDITTGLSLLENAYEEVSTVALPPDVTFYCDSAFCTIIASPKQLSDDKSALSGGKKDGKHPWIDENPDKEGGVYVKAGWTDIFDITP